MLRLCIHTYTLGFLHGCWGFKLKASCPHACSINSPTYSAASLAKGWLTHNSPQAMTDGFHLCVHAGFLPHSFSPLAGRALHKKVHSQFTCKDLTHWSLTGLLGYAMHLQFMAFLREREFLFLQDLAQSLCRYETGIELTDVRTLRKQEKQRPACGWEWVCFVWKQ